MKKCYLSLFLFTASVSLVASAALRGRTKSLNPSELACATPAGFKRVREAREDTLDCHRAFCWHNCHTFDEVTQNSNCSMCTPFHLQIEDSETDGNKKLQFTRWSKRVFYWTNYTQNPEDNEQVYRRRRMLQKAIARERAY
ncbi:MAG: hypothetical protein A2621_04890 [Alphaproteobacteria bacterium RIFCSPHIGHO2_01_FULL_41_14]|nr:MAG: hypothetical protein A3K20_04745 [Alphaproteobacteria bacterium GWA1_45_9]OFW90297.1 MAG: hypothetical protein A2621_04890 [Alphaproteobacteria bacterium RIFCSPHIGHO2_01_FULL_41_14]HCI48592.1 hypothetical protein [Holosporales bacterium]